MIKFTTSELLYQIHILPYIKVTYNRMLNDDLELIFGWLKWEFSIGI